MNGFEEKKMQNRFEKKKKTGIPEMVCNFCVTVFGHAALIFLFLFWLFFNIIPPLFFFFVSPRRYDNHHKNTRGIEKNSVDLEQRN